MAGLDLVRSLGAVEVARLDEVRLDASALGGWSLLLSLLMGLGRRAGPGPAGAGAGPAGRVQCCSGYGPGPMRRSAGGRC